MGSRNGKRRRVLIRRRPVSRTDRRIGLLFAAFLCVFAVVAARAVWLTTVRAGALRAQAQLQHDARVVEPGLRGPILDRRGRELAVSEEAVTVYANPFLIRRPAAVAARLAPLLRMSEQEILARIADRKRGFVYLRRRLAPELGERLRRLRIEGVGTLPEPRRVYPQGALATQLLGAVGTDGYGLFGLEQAADRWLRGRDGARQVVRDALGQPLRTITLARPRAGKTLRLTIDAVLQRQVERVLADTGERYAARGATAVVVDPRDGAVLALANWPTASPERSLELGPEVRRNRAVQDTYEPGSTFKPFTVAAALSEGVISPLDSFDLPPTIRVADRVIGEAHPRGWERMSVADILARSSNVGTVTIALRLGARRFDRWIGRFAFGRPTGIGLPGESPGIVPRLREYSGSSIGNLPIGQGLAITPLQLLAAYTALANQGVMHEPYVLAGRRKPGRRVLTPEVADTVARMLEGVVGPSGTGSEAQIPGYRIAGKTGTSQKPDPLTGTYSHSRYVASFVGFAPVGKPRLLVLVAVDEPKGEIYGGAVAAPAFERIVSFALPYLGIPPS